VAIQRRVHEIMVTVLNTAGDVNTPLSQVRAFSRSKPAVQY